MVLCFLKGQLLWSLAVGLSPACSSWAKPAPRCRSWKSPTAIPFAAGMHTVYTNIAERIKDQGELPSSSSSSCSGTSCCVLMNLPRPTMNPLAWFSVCTWTFLLSQQEFCVTTFFWHMGCSGNETMMGIWEQHSPMSCCRWVRHEHKAKDCKSNQFCRDCRCSAVPLGPSCVGA